LEIRLLQIIFDYPLLLGDFIMNRSAKCRNYITFCLLFLIVFGVVIAFGQKRLEDTIFNRKPEVAYKLRNAEIIPLVEDDTPPNPGNAALLYYQAFLLTPEPPESIRNIHHVTFSAVRDKEAFSAVLDKKVRRYLGSCLDVIEIVEIASRMQECIWGVWVEPIFMPSHGALRRRIHSIYDILFLDARTLAVDGHYRMALERCLTALRIVRHFREDPELYTFSIPLERYALRIVRYVLGVIPPNAEILTWFRGQLGIVLSEQTVYAKRLQEIVKADLKQIRTYPTRLARLRNLIMGASEDEQVKEKVRNLTDEQLLLYASKGLQSFLDSIFRILDSEITYEQKLAEMQKIISNLTESDDADPIIKYIFLDINIGGTINRQYPAYVGHQAYINGTKAAVEIYINVAKTGQLPKTLPDGLPKDPSTGQDFVYEITDEGFALHCRDEEFMSSLSKKLEFKVKK
jgi:hypothetical protein